MTAALDDLLVTVAAGGLPGSLREFPEGPLPEEQGIELVRAAERLGAAGFLLLCVRSGGLALPPAAIEALDEAQMNEFTTRLYLEQELLSVSRLLDAAEIEFRVLDDCAAAHLDYRDPDLRAVTRLDLLVHPRSLRQAADVLWRRGWRTPKAADAGSERGLTLVGPSGPRLVLHDGVHGAHGGTVDLRSLWSDGEPFSVHGRRLKALGSEQRLLHTSTVAVDPDQGSSLVPQRDLVEMVLFGEWKRQRLMELATAWNVQGVLAAAVRTAWQRLAIADVTGLSVWAEAYRADVRRPRRQPVGGADLGARSRSWVPLRARRARQR